MIKILCECLEGVFFISNSNKQLIRQIILDRKFTIPNDIGEYIEDMFKGVI